MDLPEKVYIALMVGFFMQQRSPERNPARFDIKQWGAFHQPGLSQSRASVFSLNDGRNLSTVLREDNEMPYPTTGARGKFAFKTTAKSNPLGERRVKKQQKQVVYHPL